MSMIFVSPGGGGMSAGLVGAYCRCAEACCVPLPSLDDESSLLEASAPSVDPVSHEASCELS